MMARATIPVDLFNPGQVFACLGFIEMAEALTGNALGAFDWSDPEQARFILGAEGEQNPVLRILECLASAKVMSMAPAGSNLSTEKWGVPTLVLPPTEPFPFRLPTSPATLPVRLECAHQGKRIILDVDHWGDSTQRDTVKFWGGAKGYPGAALFRDALDLVRDDLMESAHDPFSLCRPQSSSFRFDWRRDYIPIDAGFSPNEHDEIVMMGFPVVEIMATIGLTNARPRKVEHSKLEYHYGVLGLAGVDDHLYDPIFLRAALGGAEFPFPRRMFLMRLGWPGQENQARCITTVTEET